MKNKKILSWAMYDWANSAFSTTVMAGFFPVFLKAYWGQGVSAVTTTTHLGTTLSISGLAMALISPSLGVLADYRGYKKLFLMITMLVGVFGCVGLGLLQSGDWVLALWIYGLASMAFNASSVFYDSLLPSLAKGTDMDYASSFGFSLGYLGGGVLFLMNVIWTLKPELFGFADNVEAVKASFVSVGIWWFLFSLPLFKNVPEPPTIPSSESILQLTKKSLSALKLTFQDIRKDRNIWYFLLAYWLYIDGVYTVITMAVDYGMSLGLESKDLISALLITQFIGFPFALLFGKITKRYGCRGPILFCIVVYSIMVVLGTMMSEGWHFYVLAGLIGMVQGGVQSLSRSLYGNMIPPLKSGEYFAFFNMVGRFASILGPLIVGLTVYLTQNQKLGLSGLLVLFISGGYLLSRVSEPRYS